MVFAFAISLTVEGKVLWTHKEFDPKNYLNGMNATHVYHHGSGSFVSYDLYLSKDFDFRRGGKLPGLFGGWTNCSGGRHSDQFFSNRFMWREDGDGEVYGYIPDYHHQVHGFCDQLYHVYHLIWGYSLGRGSWKWKRSQWQHIAQSVPMNTIGKTDGGIKVWHEGKLVYERLNLTLTLMGYSFPRSLDVQTFPGHQPMIVTHISRTWLFPLIQLCQQLLAEPTQ